MNNLADRPLEACPPGTAPLSHVTDLMGSLPDWILVDGVRISGRFRFPDFVTAIAFVNAITEIAEAAGHHPDLTVRWGEVGVTMWTHSIGGLHINDFIVAAQISRAYA